MINRPTAAELARWRELCAVFDPPGYQVTIIRRLLNALEAVEGERNHLHQLVAEARNYIDPEEHQAWEDAAYAVVQPCDAIFDENVTLFDENATLRAERDTYAREADRWRHRIPIEGDYVCPDSLRADEAERERDEARANGDLCQEMLDRFQETYHVACACNFDDPGDVCMVHERYLDGVIRQQRADLTQLRRRVEAAAAIAVGLRRLLQVRGSDPRAEHAWTIGVGKPHPDCPCWRCKLGYQLDAALVAFDATTRPPVGVPEGET